MHSNVKYCGRMLFRADVVDQWNEYMLGIFRPRHRGLEIEPSGYDHIMLVFDVACKHLIDIRKSLLYSALTTIRVVDQMRV